MTPPALPQATRDAEHLRLLTVFHYVVAGLDFLFSSIFLIHVGIGIAMLARPDTFNGPHGGPPAIMGAIFIVLPGAFILFGWTTAVLTIISGRRIQRRISRTFSIVIAALNCLFMPFGTVLGVFTIVVLLRDSVRELYGDNVSASA